MISTIEKRITKIDVSLEWTASERKTLSKKIQLAKKLTQKELDRHSKFVSFNSPFKKQCVHEIKYYKLLLSVLKIAPSKNLEANRKSFNEFVFQKRRRANSE